MMLDYNEQLCLMLYQAFYGDNFAASGRDLEAMTHLLYVVGQEIFPELKLNTRLQCSIMANTLIHKRKAVTEFYKGCPRNWLNEYFIADCKRAFHVDWCNHDDDKEYEIDKILMNCANVKNSAEMRYMQELDKVLKGYAEEYDGGRNDYRTKCYEDLVLAEKLNYSIDEYKKGV